MATTSPDSIAYPDASYTSGFVAAMAAMATSIQTAFSKRGYRWADATARAAQTGMVAGDKGFQLDTLVTYRYSGSAWKGWECDWITYTPTLTNMTLGNGTFLAEYKFTAGRVIVRYSFTLGSTSAMGTIPSFTLPVTPRSIPFTLYTLTGSGGAYDTSAGSTTSSASFHRFNGIQTGTTPVSIVNNPAGASNYTATAPMTWATGDVLFGEFTYDPA